MTGKPLTSKQSEIVEVIRKALMRDGQAPTVREIGKQTGLRSSCSVQKHLNQLEARGVIKRDPYKYRSIELTQDGAREIARRSRGTPRIATRLLRRVRDIAAVQDQFPVDKTVADAALTRLEVDSLGLDAMDRRYLLRIAEHHNGGPVGVDTLAAALAEARDTLEDVVEPYLIQEGLILRTSRGETHPKCR